MYISRQFIRTQKTFKNLFQNASAIASGNPTANTVVAADILSGDRANLRFAYKLYICKIQLMLIRL